MAEPYSNHKTWYGKGSLGGKTVIQGCQQMTSGTWMNAPFVADGYQSSVKNNTVTTNIHIQLIVVGTQEEAERLLHTHRPSIITRLLRRLKGERQVILPVELLAGGMGNESEIRIQDTHSINHERVGEAPERLGCGGLADDNDSPGQE